MTTIFYENAKLWYGAKHEDSLDENVSVGEWAWRMMRNKSPNEICQISDTDNVHLTYNQALSNAIKLAKQMRKWQLTYYDIIGVIATNTTYTMHIILAAWFNGLAFQAINPVEKEEAIYYLLNKTKPKLIFCDGIHLEKLQNALNTFYPIVCTLCNHVDNNLDVIKIEDLLASKDDDRFELFCTEPLREGSDQTVAILCTSGTTGLPKCVRVTNEMCLMGYGFLSKNSSTLFSFCNIDWLFGFYGLLGNVLHGNLRIVTSQQFSPAYMSQVISKYKVECLLVTPNQIAQSLEYKELLQSLKFVWLTGSFCSKESLHRVWDSLPNATVINIYGTSECGPIAANFANHNPKSVGQLVSNVELKIVDVASDEKLGPNEIGVVCVKNIFHSSDSAYYGDVGAFYKILDKEDFIVIGDLGYMDTEHYLHICDRHDIVLQYQSFYYSPHELELIICEMKNVKDVCVVGILEEGKGDVPAAVVVQDVGCSLTEQTILDYVNLRKDSLHNCFDYGVFFVKDIPRNHNGKILIKEVIDLCRNLRNKENLLNV